MSQEYKLWYDYDPILIDVIALLRTYQAALKAQAEVLL